MQSLTRWKHNPLPVDHLQAEIRKVCGGFDLEPEHRRDVVDGDVSTRRVGLFDTVLVALDKCRIERGSRLIKQDPGDHLFLLIQDEGHCRVEQSGASARLTPGDMFLVDSVQPSTFIYDGDRSSQISVHLPRVEMLHRFGEVCTGGVAIERADPLWVAMRAVIAKMVIEPTASAPLGEAFLSLMGAYFHAMQRPEKPAGTLLSRALALIDRHGANPSFGPGELAGRLNVSERMLQRHFQQLGETPGHRLLNRRLELARLRLASRRQGRDGGGIAAIAYDSGFNDLSYFYREFRKKYGMTPGAVVG